MAFIGRKPTPSALTSSDISADIIDATKIADDAISEEHLDPTIITGLTALGATPADTDELLVSDAGTLKRVDYSYLKGGIEEIDMWVLTADNQNFTTYGAQNNSYISRHSGSDFTHKGTGMTLNHATHFSFPSTGYWYVSLKAQWRIEITASCRGLTSRIDVSTDGGSSWNDNYALSQRAVHTFDGNNDYTSTDATCVIEVDDISTVFVRGFWVSATASNEIDLSHDDPDQSTGWTFIKLAGM